MTSMEQLVEKFKEKLFVSSATEKYKNEIVLPLVSRIFNEKFVMVFENLANELNSQLNFNAVSFQTEGKVRFILEGRYHRIYFQKGKVDILDDFVTVSIIPIYIWKGVTKHLKPVSFFLNLNNEEIKWNISFDNVEDYSKSLFCKLVDDEDFFM